MTSGRKAYEDLGSQVEALRAETATQSRRLARLSADFEQLQAQEAREIERLAQLHLGELAARQSGDRFGAAEREAMAQLEQRDAALQRCDAGIEASEQKQRELESQRERNLAELERQQERFQQEHDAVADRARADAAWQQLDEQADRLAAQAALAQEKAEQAEADRVAKGQPYESDALFLYLWRRQYGSAGYRAGALVRSLDGWVAGLIDYRAAARNYQLLLALPEQLRQHAQRMQDLADQARVELEVLEQQALDQAGVSTLAAELARTQAQVETLTAQIQAEEQRHSGLLAERAALVEGEDEHTRAALATLARAITSSTGAELQRAAQATPAADDDAVVAGIARLRSERERLSRELADGKREHEQRLAALARVEELRRKFRQQRYDSGDSEIDSSLDWSVMLGGVLRGVLDAGRAWERVQRHQRFRTPRVPGAATSSVGSRQGQGRTRGVFGGGQGAGGFGGSGFKTGGGLRGGGFKTGGGF